MTLFWIMIFFTVVCLFIAAGSTNNYSNGCYHEWEHYQTIGGTMHTWKCKNCPATKTTGAGIP